jgi:hypothetical protein
VLREAGAKVQYLLMFWSFFSLFNHPCNNLPLEGNRLLAHISACRKKEGGKWTPDARNTRRSKSPFP